MDLAAKDAYIQKLASKVISQRENEPKKRPFVHFQGKNGTDPPKKNKKNKKKDLKNNATNENSPKPQQKPTPSPKAQRSPAAAKQSKVKTETTNGATTHMPEGRDVVSTFSTVDALRKRLHQKIEESRGQGAPKDALSEAVQAKRAKRKLERERKKRKRKDFLMKKLAEESGKEPPAEIKKEKPQVPVSVKRTETAIIFNKVETVEQEYVDKMLKKKKKKQSVKGQLTPLTGKNYKQLLSRVEARKAKLEQLKEKDEAKAEEMEMKMKWTNLLYKAEGIKIKDDEDMLRSSLKKKEKKREQRKKNWEERSGNVVEKMQKRQDKRKKNLQKRKQLKIENKKSKARKRGRVLPEDLKKAAV
ncbi:surfeit locus protein 6 [Cololabis saira]|uniref:surfeit locus protein 6 n=1 Tax=Cololabis saira TaxID=129043 RepID=UPI002AD3161B|nr:surfeit locus protein 6 [Cololabis saira]